MTDGEARSRVIRYLLAGLVNTAASYVALIALMHWTGYVVAYTLAYVLGIALGYWLQTRFVFRVPLHWRSALAFPLGYIAQYLAGVVALWFLVERLETTRELAAFIVIVMNVPLGYFVNRYVLMPRAYCGERTHGRD